MGLQEKTLLFLAWACLLGRRLRTCCRSCLARYLQLQHGYLHLCAAKSGGFVSYGMDNFMTIGLFYLMLLPLPDRFSLDWRLRALRPQNPQLLGFWRARASASLVPHLFL